MDTRDTFYKTLLDHLYDGVYFLNPDRKITYWNQGAERISGYKAENVLGKSCMDNILIHANEAGTILCKDHCPVAATLLDGMSREADVFLHHHDGHRVPVSVRVAPIFGESNEIIGAVEIFNNNSDKIATVEKLNELERLSLLDGLTHLANRKFIESDINAQLNIFSRHQMPFGILFIDIDNFKTINDRFGHITGDEILKMVANTLVSNVRSFETAGRWGGEEFVILCINVDEHTLYKIAEKLRNLVCQSSLPHEQGFIATTISIGGTLVQIGDTASSLLKRADQLMYQSKLAGKNRTTIG